MLTYLYLYASHMLSYYKLVVGLQLYQYQYSTNDGIENVKHEVSELIPWITQR